MLLCIVHYKALTMGTELKGIEGLEHLTDGEVASLLKFPAYMSLLAANADGKMDEKEKKAAIKFTHIKTFHSDPKLATYYAAVGQTFEQDIEALDNQLPAERHARQKDIEAELKKLTNILAKLSPDFQQAMVRSMYAYKDHVSHAHYNVLESFVMPIVLRGITEQRI